MITCWIRCKDQLPSWNENKSLRSGTVPFGLWQGADLGPFHNHLNTVVVGLAPLCCVMGKPVRQVWQKSWKLWIVLCERDTNLGGTTEPADCLLQPDNNFWVILLRFC